MDANITKKRLGHMLSYDWIKILLTILGAIVVWSLVFTMTATRITSAQQFTVFNYVGNLSFQETNFYDVYNRAFAEGKFSGEVIELDQFDLPMQADLASTQLEAHLGTGNGDLVFAAKIPNQTSAAYKDPVTGEDAHYTYLEEFLRAYRYQVFNLSLDNENSFFKSMERYLNGYFNGDYVNGTLDKAKAERDFRARIAKNKDKRYKKEAQIAAGLESEYERLEKYRVALKDFYGYLDKGYVKIEATEIRNTQNPSITDAKAAFSLNLCPETDALGNENPMKKLALTLGYKTKFVDEQGEEKPTTSAVDMHVCFLNLEGVEPGYEYEGLLFVNELIRTALAA